MYLGPGYEAVRDRVDKSESKDSGHHYGLQLDLLLIGGLSI